MNINLFFCPLTPIVSMLLSFLFGIAASAYGLLNDTNEAFIELTVAFDSAAKDTKFSVKKNLLFAVPCAGVAIHKMDKRIFSRLLTK